MHKASICPLCGTIACMHMINIDVSHGKKRTGSKKIRPIAYPAPQELNAPGREPKKRTFDA